MALAKRYQENTLASQALRNALRKRVMMRLYDAQPGTFDELDPKKQSNVLARSSIRYRGMRRENTRLEDMHPLLRSAFGAEKTLLQDRKKKKPNTPPVTNNPNPTNPYIQINANGQLDLPYDQQFAGYLLDAKDQMNQRLLQMQQQEQQQALDFATSQREAGLDYQEAARAALNYNAGKGVAFSSAYAKDAAENATNYNNYVTDLSNADTLFKQGMTAERSGIETTFNDMLRRWALKQAEKAAKDAGKLGYGKPKDHRERVNPPKGGKRRPQPKSGGGYWNKHNRKDRIGPQGNLQRPKAKAPVGKRWVPVKGKKGKVIKWKLVRK